MWESGTWHFLRNWSYVICWFSAGGLLNRSAKQRMQPSTQEVVTVDAGYAVCYSYNDSNKVMVWLRWSTVHCSHFTADTVCRCLTYDQKLTTGQFSLQYKIKKWQVTVFWSAALNFNRLHTKHCVPQEFRRVYSTNYTANWKNTPKCFFVISSTKPDPFW